ncbi:cupin domain-containing protein [Halobacteriales archaeon SW_5_70_135]|nr:MAG: cupin domain-containing protein [Halobacteriales archaeon SW_5_70_135]
MRKIDPAETETGRVPADVIRPLSDALGTTDVAVNYYELAPGESTAYGLHAHGDQEDVFHVLSGEVTFETRDEPVRASAGELVRVGHGEYQRTRNGGEERAPVLALGAPKGGGDTEILRACPDCGTRTGQELSLNDDRTAVGARCVDCDTVTGEFD